MRTKILSAKKVAFYKMVMLVVWSFLLGFVFYGVYHWEVGFVWAGFCLAYYSFFFYKLYILRTAHLKAIEYDDTSLYVIDNNQEIEIPFAEIREIHSSRLFGVHDIRFRRNMGVGMEIYFKSSLLYPLNFKLVNHKVLELRKRIGQAKAYRKVVRKPSFASPNI